MEVRKSTTSKIFRLRCSWTILAAANGKNIYLVGGGTLGHGNQPLTENNREKFESQLPLPLNIKHSSLN